MDRPNILFVFPEDWGRYASAYAEHDHARTLNKFVRTPNFDRVAAEGLLFLNARTPAPGCNPCRSSMLSGRYFWQTGLGAIEQGTAWDESIPTFPLELEKSGYFMGYTYEGDFGKTNARVGGKRAAFNSAGRNFGDFSSWVTRQAAHLGGIEAAKAELLAEVRGNFRSFLDAGARGARQPFCYIWGPTTTHRGAGWEPGSGKKLWGIDPDALQGQLPDFLPDVHVVREDVSDYLGECCAMDFGLGVLLEELEERGQLDDTLIVICGDHGMPGFPRAKANLYDFGTQVALAARWPGNIAAGRVVEDFVNLMDLAPTLCEAGGLSLPRNMAAQSLMPIFRSPSSGQVQAERDFVVSGLERHVSISREGFLPYPQRSLRTREFLYIINFESGRWPLGDPHGLEDATVKVSDPKAFVHETMLAFPDLDAGHTKAWLLEHRSDPGVAPLFQIAVGKRPREELYDVCNDPHSMRNLAGDPAYAAVRSRMHARLMSVLVDQQDPRVVEQPCRFESEPYAGIISKYTTDEGRAFLERLRRERSQWHSGTSKL
mmetsp:Transcript_51541/g.130287  ORF Transcript_51541/g.130287 Transcript_51541/m.130287 type:complete len:544 (+) Transcript_51541:83-1714(+)